jgi:hypothetical protein
VTARNSGRAPADVTLLACRLLPADVALEEQHVEPCAFRVPPGGTETRRIRWRVPALEDAPRTARAAFVVQSGGLDWQAAVTAALPAWEGASKIETARGRHVAVALRASRVPGWKSRAKVLDFLDRAYEAMADLTGYRPHNGAVIVLHERDGRFFGSRGSATAWLPAGDIAESLARWDRGEADAAWLEALGAVFDRAAGPWYAGSANRASAFARLKAAYVLQTVTEPSFRWGGPAPGFGRRAYPAPEGRRKDVALGQKQATDAWLLQGDPYLGDPKRLWSTMRGEEWLSFHLRVARMYGWETYRKAFGTWRALAAGDAEPPRALEDLLALTAAVLSRHTGADLVPLYRGWRLPVTPESAAAMEERYLKTR